MDTLRNIPANDVVYAMPIVVWVISFGLARHLPSSLFKQLCLRFPLSPAAPTIDPADMDLPENVQATMAALTEAAAASGEPMRQSREDLYYEALGIQRRRYFMSLLRYPLNLARYWWSILSVSDAEERGEVGGAAASNHRSVRLAVQSLHSLARCFTALCVHANWASLVSSIFTYLNTLAAGKQCDFRYEAVGDLAGALVAAMLTNALMLYSVKALNRDGFQAQTRANIVAHRPVLQWIRTSLLPLLKFLLLLYNANSIAFRFGYNSSSRASGAPTTPRGSTGNAENAEQTFAEEAAVAGGDAAVDGEGYTPSVWARAAGAIEVTPPPSANNPRAALAHPRARLPPMAYLCGGENLAYAFAGFRFVYRRDVVQLRGAAWNFWYDSIQSFVTVGVRRGGSDAPGDGSTSLHAQPLPSNNPFTTVDSTTGDVYFTSASSEALNQQSAVAFLAGCAVGAAALQGPLMLRVARKTPLLSRVVNYVSPPPLPAIDIPEGLMEATQTDLGVVRLYYHRHRHHPRLQQQPSVGGENGVPSNRSRSWEAIDVSENGSLVLDTDPLPGTQAPGAGGSSVPDAARDGRDDYVDIPVPPQCFCPITRCLMRDPVRTVDGFTYDRDAITAWLRRRATSPMTNLPLGDAKLVSNREVYAQVQGIVATYNAFAAQHHAPPEGPVMGR